MVVSLLKQWDISAIVEVVLSLDTLTDVFILLESSPMEIMDFWDPHTSTHVQEVSQGLGFKQT